MKKIKFTQGDLTGIIVLAIIIFLLILYRELGQITGDQLTLSLVLLTLYSLLQTNTNVKKQLSIEQEPYPVISEGIDISGIDNNNLNNRSKDFLKLKIINVGRGPAIRITVNSNKKNPEEGFFDISQPHTIDLQSNATKNDWLIDVGNFRKVINIKEVGFDKSKMKHDIVLYIHYKSQLGKNETTLVKLRFVDGEKSYFKVMENIKIS